MRLPASASTPSDAAPAPGILLYLLGVFFFAVNDALGKWLVADYGVGQLLMLRSIGAGLVLAALVWRERPQLWPTGQWCLNLARVGFMAGDTFCFYAATRDLPLADVMTFYMAAPLIITALSVPLLGETVGPLRWSAVVVGFVGVLIALQPSGTAIAPAALIALTGGVMFALAVTITRKLRGAHAVSLVSWQFAFAGLVGAAASPLGWTSPPPSDLALMFVLGIVSMACFLCITRALAIAPASLLAPFQYTSIVWAAILGVIVWGDRPTPAIVLGNAVIVASGLFIWWRERRRGGAASQQLEPIP